jgi:site-specific recombinase XerD
MTSFQNFWEKYKNQAIDSQTFIDIEKKFYQYSALIDENQKLYSILKTILRDIPIGVALRYWINTFSFLPKQKQISCQIERLIDHNILPIQNQNGQLLSLDFFQEQGEQEHQKIIMAIRNFPGWSASEKIELIQCYAEFTHHLNRNTFGVIPAAHDPDQIYALNKVIPYNDFIKFVQQLPVRDALIAQLLYFGGPTVEEVLNLKCEQLDFKNNMIDYTKKSVSIPKHVLKELSKFIGKKKKTDLIFLTDKGKQVLRNHLNQSFGQISKETNIKITPRDLLKLKI